MKKQLLLRSPFFRVLFLILLALPLGKLHAQPTFRFEHITYEDGLSHVTTTVILQDRRGFMWFGTYNGLNRYDGYQLKNYRNIPGDTTSLSSNSIWALSEDQDGSIWIGTVAGLNRYDPAKDAFKRYFHDPQNDSSISDNFVWALQLDYAGNLWVGTTMGLNRYDRENDSFVRYHHNPDDPQSLTGNTIFEIYEDPNQTLWVQTPSGLNKYDPAPDAFVQYPYDPDDPKSIAFKCQNVFEDLIQDKNDLMWLSSTEGLFYFDPDKKGSHFNHYKFEPDNPYSLSDDNVFSIFLDAEDHLWVGTDGGGLNLYDRERDRFHRYLPNDDDPYSLSDDVITDIFEDANGNLWIATHFGGVNFLSHQTRVFHNYPPSPKNNKGPNHKTISSVLERADGSFWLGTKAGLNYFDRKTDSFHYYHHDPDDPNSLSQNDLQVLLEDHTGVLWIGTLYGGLNKFDPISQRFTRYLPDDRNSFAVSGSRINNVFEDREGNVWIGSNNGLDRYDRVKDRFIHYGDENIKNGTWRLFEDSHGLFWVETFWHDLKRIEKDKPRSISYIVGRVNDWLEDSQKQFWIAAGKGIHLYDRQRDTFLVYLEKEAYWFYEDSKARFWIGTHDGIEQLDTKNRSSRVILKKEDLPGEIPWFLVRGEKMVEDDQGNLWLGSSKGLVKYNPQTRKSQYFDKRDGLIGNSISVGQKLSSGEILFKAQEGFVIFHPDSLEENTQVPEVVLADFQLFKRSLPIKGSAGDTLNFASPLTQSITYTKVIVLEYWQNDISLEFAALNYTSPNKNKYAYRLQGYSEDWVYTDADMRIATYTNLNPGTYTFRVKGSNNDGLWNEEGTALKIIIAPPWWLSWWAKTIYALLFFGVLYSIRHLELQKQQRKLEREQEKLAQQQRVNAVTSKFVPNAFIHSLGRKDIMEVKLGDAVQQEVTVMFSDIRDYTTLSENMTPEENFRFVNAYNRRMGPVIQQNQGFVNQYLGDAIMALFKSSPRDCLTAAIQMQQTLTEYNRQRIAKNLSPIRLGIGLHTGSLIMGIIGDDQRMDAATISDTVNTASRIESLTKHFKVNILLSEESLTQIQQEGPSTNGKPQSPDFNTRFLGEVQLKGKKEPVGIFECFDGDLPEVIEMKRRSMPLFKEGMDLYFSRQFRDAATAFKKVLEINAKDQTARFFFNRTTAYLANGVEEDWTGVEVMTFK